VRRGPAIIAFIAFLACIYGTIVCVQNKLSAISASAKVPSSMAYLPESEKIRPWLLGFHSAFADYLWIRTTIYFGGHLMGDREFPWLIHMVDIITRLNPRFYPAYEFGGLMFSKICNNPEAAKIVLQRGISANIEKKWKLCFFLGMLYYERYFDCQNAAVYIAIAAQLPGAPAQKLTSLAVSMYNKVPGLAQDGRFLALLYTTSENPEVRRFLLEKLNAATADKQ
jgi:hypothetical protein